MSPEQNQIPISVFLLAFVWTFVGAAAPTCGVVGLWLTGMANKPDWPTLWHHAVFTGGLAAVGFWRKHKAYLALPPAMEAAQRLMTITTTVQTTADQMKPTDTVVTTVAETHTEQIRPTVSGS